MEEQKNVSEKKEEKKEEVVGEKIVQVFLDEETHRALKEAMRNEGEVRYSTFIRKIIRRYLGLSK